MRSGRLLNILIARTTAAEGNAAPPDAGGMLGGAEGTHMRLLGEIFRPSRNQVTWGWGKLAMRGARMTAASPWDTLCCVSLSSKLPMSAERAGEHVRGWGGQVACRGCPGFCLLPPPQLGGLRPQGLLLYPQGCAGSRIGPRGTHSCTAP